MLTHKGGARLLFQIAALIKKTLAGICTASVFFMACRFSLRAVVFH
jgi:hypothetical protein